MDYTIKQPRGQYEPLKIVQSDNNDQAPSHDARAILAWLYAETFDSTTRELSNLLGLDLKALLLAMRLAYLELGGQVDY